jgi:hypothetical protein
VGCGGRLYGCRDLPTGRLHLRLSGLRCNHIDIYRAIDCEGGDFVLVLGDLWYGGLDRGYRAACGLAIMEIRRCIVDGGG